MRPIVPANERSANILSFVYSEFKQAIKEKREGAKGRRKSCSRIRTRREMKD